MSRAWRVDIALAVAYLVVMAVPVLVEPGRPPTLTQVVQLAFFPLLILSRRRTAEIGVATVAVLVPVLRWLQTGSQRNGIDPTELAAWGIDSAATVAGYDLGTLVLLLYAAGAHRPPQRAWAAYALATVAVLGSVLLYTDRWAWTVEILAGGAVLLAATVLGLQVRTRRERLAELEERARRLALERDQREQLAVTTERTRIAREMHDVLAHSLSVMVALSDGAAAALERHPEAARTALQELSATGRTALADTRRLVGVLRAEDGAGGGRAPQPGSDQLADLVERFRLARLPVRLTESGPPLPDDPALHLAVHRIVQEALTNVLRHEPTSPRIDVTVRRAPGEVVLVVDNDRAPGDSGRTGGAARAPVPAGDPGRGLIGIRERAAVFDGGVEAGPTSRGWRVRVVLRWREA